MEVSSGDDVFNFKMSTGDSDTAANDDSSTRHQTLDTIDVMTSENTHHAQENLLLICLSELLAGNLRVQAQSVQISFFGSQKMDIGINES